MTFAQFQEWLNERGANLVVDGKAGPATRAAIMAVFSNKQALKVTGAQISEYAARLGGTAKQLKAVMAVEASGAGYLPSGHPKILYERHYFWKRLKIKIPLLSDPVGGGYTLDANRNGINDSWEKLCDAAMRNPVAAFESVSWGKPQVMGAWWQRLGYASVFDFAYSFVTSEAGHYEAMVRYIDCFGLRAAFKAISAHPNDCQAFAKGYNGKGYEKFAYHIQISRQMI